MAEELTSLRLVDLSDRELLHRVNDVADEEGWVTAQEVADALGIVHDHPTACVGSRFQWLRRYGALERDGDRWRMTEEGHSLAFGTLSALHRASLTQLPQDRMLDLMRVVSRRYQQSGDVAATLMRREWTYGMAHRS